MAIHTIVSDMKAGFLSKYKNTKGLLFNGEAEQRQRCRDPTGSPHENIWQTHAVSNVSLENARTATLVASFITLPQMFLSGVIIPISHSSGVLLALSRIMPMTCCLDLTRAVVYAGTPEYHSVVLFHPLADLVVIITLTAIFLGLGTYLFACSESHR